MVSEINTESSISLLATTGGNRDDVQVFGYREVPLRSADLSSALENTALVARPDEGLALQVTIPFCSVRCTICDRVAEVASDPGGLEPYLNSLGTELALMATGLGGRRALRQLHIGGGTPSLLSGAQLARVAQLVDSHFALEEDCETVFEINPDRTSLTQLELIRGLGFKNIRIEVRELDPVSQQGLGRSYSPELLDDAITNAKNVGFEQITLDLIYGLPGQTVRSLRESIHLVADLNPDRITCRPFVRNEKRFEHQRVIDADTMPSATENMAGFAVILDVLEATGYEWIGVNCFVRPDDVLAVAQREGSLTRNRLGYSDRPVANLLGVGLGAITELGTMVVRNSAVLTQWHDALDAGEHPVVGGIRYNDQEISRRSILARLSSAKRLPIAAFANEDSSRFLTELIEAGLVEVDEVWVHVNLSGQLRTLQAWDSLQGDVSQLLVG